MTLSAISCKILVFCVALFICFNLALTILKSQYQQNKSQSAEFSGQSLIFDQDADNLDFLANELDGCYHVFLDVGSNIGNTIRKLYEPHLFINATYLPIFKQYFGDSAEDKSVCSVGFEPNPRHVKTLQKLQSSYENCGWKTVFHTTTAAAHSYGLATFFSDQNDDNFEWAGSILESKNANHPSGITKVIRLSDYILNKVVNRQLPRSLSASQLERKPNVVMKLDVEGSELEVLTDLLVTGALQHIDLVTVEYHSLSFTTDDIRSAFINGLEKAIETITYLSQKLKLKNPIHVKAFDDESYGKVKFTLPQC